MTNLTLQAFQELNLAVISDQEAENLSGGHLYNTKREASHPDNLDTPVYEKTGSKGYAPHKVPVNQGTDRLFGLDDEGNLYGDFYEKVTQGGVIE